MSGQWNIDVKVQKQISSLIETQYVLRIVLQMVCVRLLGYKPWDPGKQRLYRNIVKRLVDVHETERLDCIFFRQRSSVAIRRGNASSLLRTFSPDHDLGLIF